MNGKRQEEEEEQKIKKFLMMRWCRNASVQEPLVSLVVQDLPTILWEQWNQIPTVQIINCLSILRSWTPWNQLFKKACSNNESWSASLQVSFLRAVLNCFMNPPFVLVLCLCFSHVSLEWILMKFDILGTCKNNSKLNMMFPDEFVKTEFISICSSVVFVHLNH